MAFEITDIQQNEILDNLRMIYKKFQHDMKYIEENIKDDEKKEKGIRYNKSMMTKVTNIANVIKQIPVKKTKVDDCPF